MKIWNFSSTHVLENEGLNLSIAVTILLDFSNYCQTIREITRGKTQYTNQQYQLLF